MTNVCRPRTGALGSPGVAAVADWVSFAGALPPQPMAIARTENAQTRRMTTPLDDAHDGRLRFGLVSVRAPTEFAIEQDVGPGAKYAMLRPMAVAEHRRGRQADSRPALTDEEGRDRHMQAIEELGR